MSEMDTRPDAAARRALKDDLARYSCCVAQPDDPPLFTREPEPDAKSVHWRWRDLAPLLERIGREVDLEAKGPRRTLRLQNPGLSYGTTVSFWASIQVILPGEVATAHRHSASAFRFVMQGNGATTTVDGERYAMHEGDLVLTPPWTWHDHRHHGDKPMIWLDVLDISLMRSLRASFFEGYSQPEQDIGPTPERSYQLFGSGLMSPPGSPAIDPVNPLLVYGRDMARRALNEAAHLPPDPCDDVILEYRNPADGGPAMRNLSMTLQILRPGFEGRARRHMCSKLYYVVEGAGTTTAGGERWSWEAGDFFTIAPWAWHRHAIAPSAANAVLFQVSDLPVYRALGYDKEETTA